MVVISRKCTLLGALLYKGNRHSIDSRPIPYPWIHPEGKGFIPAES